ncbi:MAG: hypothetical protein R3E39_20250 [Anaerolineae bacterium]
MAALTQANRRLTNPIVWQETQHLKRPFERRHHAYWAAGLFLLAAAVAVIALTLDDFGTPTHQLGIYLIWIIHTVAAARAISAGANAISREHVGKTWDPLVLTGISARRILYGKWCGVLNRVAPWMAILGAVRLIMIPIFMLSLVHRYAWYSSSYSRTYYSFENYTPVGWLPWAAVCAVLMTLLLTMLEVFACTALGMAASALTRRGWTAMIVAFCIRLIPVALFAAFTRYEIGNGPYWRVLSFPAISLADAGTGPLWQLSLPLTGWTQQAHVQALPGVGLAAMLLFSYVVGSLVTTWWSIRTAGALPHESL